ncbi:putative Beta-lactamase-related domain-containing protein [Seiridium unicorne]|uniref:Beta-lactamase-related domain-containing protein n=1 Tax=Seiridium unicorne TaxID=138068 RepID=A0ABR2VBX3_9PEZI
MAEVNGHCDPKFNAVREALEKYITSAEENGASLAVNVGGQDVISLWGGYADIARTEPWKENTIVNVFSCTKIVSALALLKLVDQGRVSVNDKVAKHWPEFAANGKENIEIRHILSHSSGVAGWEKPLTMEGLCDLEARTAELAQQAPFWEPGTMSGYHCWDYGHLVGEVVRRVTGSSLRDFVAKELAEPFGADVQIGCKEEDWGRVAEVTPPPALNVGPIPADSIPGKILNPFPDATFTKTPEWKNAQIGAANGHSNAQGCARLFSNVTLAGSGGKLLSKETVDTIFQEQTRGVDAFNGMFIRWGIGMALRGDGETALDDWLPPGRVCLWGGWGGSLGIMDLDRKVTISYVMNKMRLETPVTPPAREYIKEIYKALGVEW